MSCPRTCSRQAGDYIDIIWTVGRLVFKGLKALKPPERETNFGVRNHSCSLRSDTTRMFVLQMRQRISINFIIFIYRSNSNFPFSGLVWTGEQVLVHLPGRHHHLYYRRKSKPDFSRVFPVRRPKTSFYIFTRRRNRITQKRQETFLSQKAHTLSQKKHIIKNSCSRFIRRSSQSDTHVTRW